MAENIDIKQLQPFAHIELLAKQVVEGFITGLHKSPYHGFSVEFAEHRLYNSGEPTRHIDWKLYGRSEKMFVKRYEEETNLRCQIVVDRSSSMYFPMDADINKGALNKMSFSVLSAAVLAYMLKRQRDAFGLTVFSENIELQTPVRSSSTHQKYVFSELERLMQQPSVGKSSSPAEVLHHVADNIHKRSLVVIFSDMFDSSAAEDDIFSALQHLKHNKHEVLLFHVVDKKHELDFEFENRPHKFIDMETGEEMKLHPSEIKENYLTSFKEYRNRLKLKCTQYHIDFIEADISKGFSEILMPYMLKRQKMK